MKAKYKIGDKIVIIKEPNYYFNKGGSMDCWLGKTMTVANNRASSGGETLYRMKEDKGRWFWRDSMIDEKATMELNGGLTISELEVGKDYFETTIHGDIVRFKLWYDGKLYWRENRKGYEWQIEEEAIARVLDYRFKPVPKPDKLFPSIGDSYFSVGLIGTDLPVLKLRWYDTEEDNKMLEAGNVFETKSSAEAALDKIEKILKGENLVDRF